MRHDTRTPEGGHPNVRQLELRRHARRDPHADRLSAAGRAQAEDVGRAAKATYDVVFVSPAQRAAETAAWFLRGAGQQLPDHEVVPGLGGQDATGGAPDGMAAGVRALLERVPDGGRGLAISHTPLVERAALGLTGDAVQPLAECEGILVSFDDGSIAIEELRLDGGSADA
jgi:phosphohistidine phosphatase SixA